MNFLIVNFYVATYLRAVGARHATQEREAGGVGCWFFS